LQSRGLSMYLIESLLHSDPVQCLLRSFWWSFFNCCWRVEENWTWWYLRKSFTGTLLFRFNLVHTSTSHLCVMGMHPWEGIAEGERHHTREKLTRAYAVGVHPGEREAMARRWQRDEGTRHLPLDSCLPFLDRLPLFIQSSNITPKQSITNLQSGIIQRLPDINPTEPNG